MSGRHPVTMMTNKDEAVEVAVAKVFPKTHHCFHTWQILNEIQEQFSDCQSCVVDEVQKCVCLTEAIEEFESEWKSILCNYNIKDDEKLQMFYNANQRWVPVYLRDTFFAQMPACKERKGINSFFHGCIDVSTTIQDFVAGYEKAAANWCEKEHEEDVQTARNKPVLKSRLPTEKQMAEMYTKTVFLRFQEEVYESLGFVVNKIEEYSTMQTYQVSNYEEQRRACTVLFNEPEKRVSCSCLMFEFSGILCRHALIVLTTADIVSIPPYSILERWTRNAKSGVGLEKRGITMQTNCLKSLYLRYNDLCNQAIRCASALYFVGAASVQDYDITLWAFREALDKIISSKKKADMLTEDDIPASDICQDEDDSTKDIAPNSISICGSQQSRARGRLRNSNLKSVLERSTKDDGKCSICREHGHDESVCPSLRPMGETFTGAGGMILEMGQTDLRAHNVIGGEQAGFSDGIL